ncbi:MAG: GH92 family glycosyl hydrolase [Tannerella sp.]|nr:GH92 family glycosyl hydrolase [Tannerella sp.]
MSGALWATPYNIAPEAKVTASSEFSDAYGCNKVCDGLIGIEDTGEWASNGGSRNADMVNYPWIQLEWEQPRSINRIILFDRPSLKSHTAGGTLHFSDGSRVSVYSIPNNGMAKVVDFSARRVKWVKFEATDADGPTLGFSEIEVYPSPEDYADYVSKVDPYIETNRGRYFFFVTGSQPFGMISAAPLTRNKNQFGGGYNYNSNEVLGFPQVHCWMLSGITLMPVTGNIDPTGGEQSWKSTFSHDGEIVQPGYQRMFLQDHGIWAEQTATDRVSFYRFRSTKNAVADILLNLGGYVSTATMTDCRLTKVSETELEGSVNTTGRLWYGPKNIRIYFVIRFDKPFEQLNGWVDKERLSNVTNLQGVDTLTPRYPLGYKDSPTAGVAARYNVKAGDAIQVKCAISYTNIENARNNMVTDGSGWNFDAVRQASQKEWNDWLGRIDVKGGTAEQQIKFYTDLWHVLLGRHKLDDASGDYPDNTEYTANPPETVFKKKTLPKDKNGVPRFHIYNSDAFWLTQWNLNILWGLAWPEVLDDFAASLVQHAENGGLLPRGPNGGGYSWIMSGCPATPLIACAYQKNMLTKTTPQQALKAMMDSHQPGGMVGWVKEIQFYIENGYYPGNAEITLEVCFQDWALSQMASKMGMRDTAAYYLKRSQGWKTLYRPDQKLIFPKDDKGNWLHDDPLKELGWVESNAWQATFSVSQDISGLAQLMGGESVLCDKLNYAFEQSEKDDFVFGYGEGYVSYANQPGCSNAHVFNYAGKPWLSQYWVRKVNEQAYGGTSPNAGYGGHDEDQGQMSGVSALMSLGLFSLQGTCSQNPGYEITSPVFDEITIRLNPEYYAGKEFKIKVNNNSAENCYIQKMKLNNKPLKQIGFSHEDYAKGGVLELWLGNKPRK